MSPFLAEVSDDERVPDGLSEEEDSEDELCDPAALRAPFPYFGGKNSVAGLVWRAFGPEVKHYIEPFCGSLAMLLAAPRRANLEVVNDGSCYVANFWRALRAQPDGVARWADYPVSHVDLAARHQWLTQPARVGAVAEALLDAAWPGCPQFAGWWVWGQCAWIGSGWCEKPVVARLSSQIPHVSDAGQGLLTRVAEMDRGEYILGRLRALSRRLQDVRVLHGDWTRCLNSHYGGGGDRVAVFLDPPYLSYERLYQHSEPVALQVAEWAARHAGMRVAVCGHAGDYDAALRGWRQVPWSRGRFTYGGRQTTDREAVYFSPACDSVPDAAGPARRSTSGNGVAADDSPSSRSR